MTRTIIKNIYMRQITDIRVLQAFITIAHEGNISRAAEKLNLTQPAVSLQLKRLAEETGLTLFDRKAKGMELTRDGQALLIKAERVYAALTDFGQSARHIKGQVRGHLKVGTVIDPNFIRLGQFLAAMVDSFPDLQTHLYHSISGEVAKRVANGQLDAGFFLGDIDDFLYSGSPGQQLDGTQFYHKVLTRFNYRVIAPAGWERHLTTKDWPELVNLPWIGTPPDSVHARLIKKALSRFDCTPNYVTIVDQEQSMLEMVRSGVGLSLCRESTALDEAQTRGIVIADLISIQTSLRFMALKARFKDPNIASAFEILSNIWGGIDAGN